MLREIVQNRDYDLEPLDDPGKVSGFSSPAADYLQERLNIVQRIVKDPTNTFYFEMASDDLKEHGILQNALLVVDRSVTPRHGSAVVVNIEGEWVAKILLHHRRNKYLTTGVIGSQAMKVQAEGIVIFGVVTWSCNPMNGLVNHIAR